MNMNMQLYVFFKVFMFRIEASLLVYLKNVKLAWKKEISEIISREKNVVFILIKKFFYCVYFVVAFVAIIIT